MAAHDTPPFTRSRIAPHYLVPILLVLLTLLPSLYQVSVSKDAASDTRVPATRATVRGLINGTPYTFGIGALNVVGHGARSALSNAVTPATVPGAPMGVGASSGNRSATVSWTAPISNGSPITGYTVYRVNPDTSLTRVASVSGTALSTTVRGLTNGQSYRFKVSASNDGGDGPPSAASHAVIPAGVPGAPTNVTARAGHGQAMVNWMAPSSNGSPITGYNVYVSDGSILHTGSTATRAVVPRLTNGTPYTFTVTAMNAVGAGPKSALTTLVTPTRPAYGIDTSKIVSAALALRLSTATFPGDLTKHISFIGRYLRDLKPAEVTKIHNAGLRIFSILQHSNDAPQYFDGPTGKAQAREAISQARAVGQPHGTPIYFAVDYDPYRAAPNDGSAANVMAYFKAVNAEFAKEGNPYAVGVYGTGQILTDLRNFNLATYFWQSQSTGFTRNENPWPGRNTRQLPQLGLTMFGIPVDLDEAPTGNPGTW
jgi:hypothetical protein